MEKKVGVEGRTLRLHRGTTGIYMLSNTGSLEALRQLYASETFFIRWQALLSKPSNDFRLML